MKKSRKKSRNTILFNGFGIFHGYSFRESRVHGKMRCTFFNLVINEGFFLEPLRFICLI